jgi:hypothetical protein
MFQKRGAYRKEFGENRVKVSPFWIVVDIDYKFAVTPLLRGLYKAAKYVTKRHPRIGAGGM